MHITYSSAEKNSDKRRNFDSSLFQLPNFKLLCVWWLPKEWQGLHSGMLWWLTFPFVLDFLRDVHGRDTGIFICFNLSKPKGVKKKKRLHYYLFIRSIKLKVFIVLKLLKSWNSTTAAIFFLNKSYIAFGLKAYILGALGCLSKLSDWLQLR